MLHSDASKKKKKRKYKNSENCKRRHQTDKLNLMRSGLKEQSKPTNAQPEKRIKSRLKSELKRQQNWPRLAMNNRLRKRDALKNRPRRKRQSSSQQSASNAS